MTKQSINVGTSPNDNRGDSLRAAFQKINANFTELYTALGLDVAPLNLGAFEFVGSTLSTTDSSAIVIDQAVTVSSNLTVGGDVLPSVANGGDLGSSARPWRSLYVSNNTIFLGGIALSVDTQGNLLVGGQSIADVGTAAWNSITGKPAFATVATTGAYADLTGKPTLFSGSYADLTGKPTLFSGSYADLTNKPDLASTYQFSVAADDSTQRVISTDEVVKFIGAGGITTSSDAEGAITITQNTGNIEFRNDSMNDINGITITNANQTTASTASITIPANGSGTVSIANNTKYWGFGSDGKISFPDNSLASNNPLTIKVPDGRPNSVSNWVGQGGWNQGSYNNLATTGGTGTGLTVNVAAGGAGYITINQITINNPGNGYTNGDVITINNENNLPGTFTIGVSGIGNWTFGNNGILTLPQYHWIESVGSNASISLNGVASNESIIELATRVDGETITSVFEMHPAFGIGLTSVRDVNITAGYDSSTIKWNLWQEREEAWVDARNLDELLYTQGTRPWAGMPSYEAVDEIANYNYTGPNPPPGSLVVVATIAKTAYETWQAEQAAINVTIQAKEKTWTFNNDGNLTTPVGLRFGGSDGHAEITNTSPNGSLYIANTGLNALVMGWSKGTNQLPVGQDVKSANITADSNGVGIELINVQDVSHVWSFDGDGSLRLPGDIKSQGNINIDINLSDSTLRRWTFGEDGTFTVPNGISSFENFEIKINADDSTLQTFKFDSAGGITLPNSAQIRPSSSTYDTALATWESARQQFEHQARDVGITAQGWPFIAWQANGENAAEYLAELTRAWQIQQQYPQVDSLVFVPPISASLYQQIRSALNIVNSAYLSADNGVSISVQSSDYLTLGKSWNFGEDGTLILPSTGKISNSGHEWTFSDDGRLLLGADRGGIYANQTTGMVTIGDGIGYDGAPAAPSTVINIGGNTNAFSISAYGPPARSWSFGMDGRTTFPNGTVPEHSYGAAGDKEGMVVFTDPYIYYCKQDYVDNSTDIWVRVAWTGTSW